jgi:ferredoxin-NADP reductase
VTVVGDWKVGTVIATKRQTGTGRSFVLEVPDWPGNIAGQHVDIRLTAPDGYQASRSYSVASTGAGTQVELAVDRLPNGEVSPYLVDELREGDQLELRGPLGGWFVWRPAVDGAASDDPVQLIAGGSGVVPLVAMLRAHAAAASTAPMRLLYSVRTPADRFFADELDAAGSTSYVYTRVVPPGWPEKPGRVTKERLAASTIPPSERPAVFVCGPTPFVEAVATWLVELGHDPARIKTERFGGN